MTVQSNGPVRKEHIWLVALFDIESSATELLDRLSALGVDTSEATTIRVEIDDHQRLAQQNSRNDARTLSPLVRSIVTGALIGSATGLPIGIFLYSTDILVFDQIDGLFNHAIISVISGAVLGAISGTIFGSYALSRTGKDVGSIPPEVKCEGFLVAVKMSPRLAERAEEIARGLGAKQILL